jgi:hypothetical protein
MSKLDFPKRKAAMYTVKIKPVRGVPEDDPARGPSDAALLDDDFASVVDRPKKRVANTVATKKVANTVATTRHDKYKEVEKRIQLLHEMHARLAKA